MGHIKTCTEHAPECALNEVIIKTWNSFDWNDLIAFLLNIFSLSLFLFHFYKIPPQWCCIYEKFSCMSWWNWFNFFSKRVFTDLLRRLSTKVRIFNSFCIVPTLLWVSQMKLIRDSLIYTINTWISYNFLSRNFQRRQMMHLDLNVHEIIFTMKKTQENLFIALNVHFICGTIS